MRDNDIAISPATSEIIIDGREFVKYDASRKSSTPAPVIRISQCSIKAESRTVILPGQKVLINIPPAFRKDDSVAVEPRLDSSHNRTSNDVWTQPQVVKVETHCITSQQHTGACYNYKE